MILALDPGGTTGWALISTSLGMERRAGQIEGRFQVYNWFEGLALSAVQAVVCERFTINAHTARKTPQLDPLYIIGHIEARCWQLGVPFYLQSPTEGKSFGTDHKLKALGWWVPNQDHAQDALRHLLTFLCTNRAGLALGGAAVLKELAEVA